MPEKLMAEAGVSNLTELCAHRKIEVARRGLMGFPIDDERDIHLQGELLKELTQMDGVKVFNSPTCNLKLPVDKLFPAQMLYYFLIGDYEEHDLQLIKKHVLHGSRALELGGGIGLTGSLLGVVSGNPVTVCEPNPALHHCIERTFNANAARLNLIKAAAVSDNEPAEVLPFHICKDYWWSSLIRPGMADTISVPTVQIKKLISESGADTLLIDIEGYEVELLSDISSLESIKTLMMEIHSPSIGTEATADIITVLIRFGFDLVDMGAQTFVFKRRPL